MSREITSPPPTIVQSESFDKKHVLEFNDGSHRYKLDSKPTVGTTTFCKGGYPTNMSLISWMKAQTAEALFQAMTIPGNDGFYPREGFWPVTDQVKTDLIKAAKLADREIAQEAADIGTITHSYAELCSLGEMEKAYNLLDEVRGVKTFPLIEECIKKYHEWEKANRGKLLMAEALIASPKYKFCGKIDRLDIVNDKLRLRDYKTSKSIYVDHFIQQAAYAIGIEEWYGKVVDEFEIVRFGKTDGSFQTLVISDPKEIKMFKNQAIRCRQTYEFIKLEQDPRFKYGGTK